MENISKESVKQDINETFDEKFNKQKIQEKLELEDYTWYNTSPVEVSKNAITILGEIEKAI
jgi:hypothetical protein